MVRMITNHLLNQFKQLTDADASNVSLSINEAEKLAIKLMNETEGDIFIRMTPGLLRSILVCWYAEWEDFRCKRIKRPVFRGHRDEQLAWCIGTGILDYQVEGFSLVGVGDVFSLPACRINLPKKTTAYLLKRSEEGQYYFASLHERVCAVPHEAQDETVTHWGEEILLLESTQRGRSRYLGEHHRVQNRQKEDSHRLITLRKIVLHRLLRNQKEKLKVRVVEEVC